MQCASRRQAGWRFTRSGLVPRKLLIIPAVHASRLAARVPLGEIQGAAKHNINIRLLGEMIARRMGKTLVAPLVTLEPGNAGTTSQPGRAGQMISQATYTALLFDMGNFLRGMGFTEIFYMGDSGGNARGMQGAADSLTKVYVSSPEPLPMTARGLYFRRPTTSWRSAR